MRRIVLILLMLLPALLWAQEGPLVLKGRVTAGGHGVPYATVQLLGTSIGVSCNDDGEYTLKLPAGHEACRSLSSRSTTTSGSKSRKYSCRRCR